jgi:hypothetical protein
MKMKIQKIWLFPALALLLVVAVVPVRGQESFTLQKDILVAKDEVQDNIFAMGGHVQVDGIVRKSVIALGGTITVSGEVKEAVVGIGSGIILTSSAVIKGDVVALGGTLTKEPGCIIGGDTVYFKSSEIPAKFFKNGFLNFFTLSFVPFILALRLILIFVWFLVALIVVAIFPRQVSLASSQIRFSFWPVFGTGVLVLTVYTGLVILAALFSLLLIGIPILLALIAVGVLIKLFGQVAIFHFFGDSLARALGNQKATPLLAVILGLILVSFLKFIPILGFLFSFVLSILGWGVAIRTKFGTTENWFRRKI